MQGQQFLGALLGRLELKPVSGLVRSLTDKGGTPFAA